MMAEDTHDNLDRESIAASSGADPEQSASDASGDQPTGGVEAVGDGATAGDGSVSTRERLLDAAAHLFLERGFAATGIAAVLKAANVRSGSLYYFFKSKDDLLIGVLERYLELLQPVIIEPAEARTDDPIERVFALLAMYREFLEATACRFGCPIGNLALELGEGQTVAREKVVQNFDNWCAGVQRWLDAAGDRLPRYTDRTALARYILTVMEGAQMQAKAQRRIEPYDASIAGLRNHFEQLEAQARAERERDQQ